ncbi:MAG: imidazole glycerol phosphate synthase subunit HisH [Parvibaculum sp.]|nr:imidazole glycerol phosphate synthase subunit HisH [Parvibaculum sp.]MDZ4381044.1 imidazole glycerol phosphate synthase subunit HisH [Parvibaculum sp.]
MNVQVAIIDYGSGNLRSAAKAFERAGRDAGLVADVLVTSDPDALRAADRIVLPGVGAFGDCRAGLDAIPGMVEALEEAVRKEAKPFFGICVGMQLMAERGLEHGVHQGLGWLEGDVVKIEPSDPSLKIPHMGWNELEVVNGHPLLEDMPATHAYFVHSYALAVSDPAVLAARTDYGGPVTAMVARDNMVGTQFHPEKSQALGLALIGNFLKWRP